MSQDDKVLAHLEGGNTITPLVALQVAGTLALHSCIARLRARGYRIDMELKRENGKQFGHYFLAVPHG